MKIKKFLSVLTSALLSVIILASCRNLPEAEVTSTAATTVTTTATTTATTTPEPVVENSLRAIAYADNLPSLKDVYADDFLVGAAAEPQFFAEGTTERLIIDKHFSALTTDRFKPDYINKTDGEFFFDDTDIFVEYGESHPNVSLRGHTLVWHQQVPARWFEGSGEGGKATSEELLSRMEEYITAVVGRYKGKIETWDVVNEVMSDSTGDLRRDDEGSQWASIIGDLDGDGFDTDYIEQAFIFAHNADPDAQLIINDYNIENSWDETKRNAFYDMVKRLLEKGIPIDGIGIQGHVRLPGSEGLIYSLEGAIEKFAELKKIKPDFAIQITELDVTLYEWQDTSKEKEFTPALQIEQAKLYQAIFEMCRRQAEKGNLELVTLWGLNDYSWLNDFPVAGRTDHPLLFDRNFHVKPAFWGVADPSKIEECANEPLA